MRLVRIGRAELNEARFEDKTVSRRHAELVITDARTIYLTDCASTGGTFVLRGGEWVRIRQDYVTRNERVRFGAYETRISEIIA